MCHFSNFTFLLKYFTFPFCWTKTGAQFSAWKGFMEESNSIVDRLCTVCKVVLFKVSKASGLHYFC